jgi:hypothetical protein
MWHIFSKKKDISRLKSPHMIPTEQLTFSLQNQGKLQLWMLMKFVIKVSTPIFLKANKIFLGFRDLKGNDFGHI